MLEHGFSGPDGPVRDDNEGADNRAEYVEYRVEQLRDLNDAAIRDRRHVMVLSVEDVTLLLDHIDSLDAKLFQARMRLVKGAATVPAVPPCELYGHDEYVPDPMSPESVCRRCGASSFDETFDENEAIAAAEQLAADTALDAAKDALKEWWEP